MEIAGLNHTAVLYALGWAIAHSIWQMGLLWLIYQMFFGLPKNMKPAFRYGAAVTFVCSGFIWFAFTFVDQFYIYQSINRYIEQLPASEELFTPGISAVADSGALLERLFSSFERFIPFLSAGYLSILIILFVRLINAYAYTQRIRTQGLIPAGDFLDEQLLQFTRKLGLSVNIKVYLTELIDVPATIGFFKPVILLPLASINHLSTGQVESIILHELAHIRRHDYLLNILISIMETVLFFNPFAYLLVNGLKKERELFCDDFVLAFKNDPHNYASALLHLEKLRKGSVAILAVAATGHDGLLLNRVKRIMKVNSPRFQYREKIIALFFISGLLSTLAWLDPVPVTTMRPAMVKEKNSTNFSVEPATLSELIHSDQTFETVQKIKTNKQASYTSLKSMDSLPSKIIAQPAINDKTVEGFALLPSFPTPSEDLIVKGFGANEFSFASPGNLDMANEEYSVFINDDGLLKKYAPFSTVNDSLRNIPLYRTIAPDAEKELKQLIEKALRLSAEQKPVPVELITRIQHVQDMRFNFHYNAKNRRMKETTEGSRYDSMMDSSSAEVIYFNQPPPGPVDRLYSTAGTFPGNRRKTETVKVAQGQPFIQDDGQLVQGGSVASDKAAKRKIVKGQTSTSASENLYTGDEMRQLMGNGAITIFGSENDNSSDFNVTGEKSKRRNGYTFNVDQAKVIGGFRSVNRESTSTVRAYSPSRNIRAAKEPIITKTSSPHKIIISIETTNETISIELGQDEDD